jgi:hypothetical protein
LSMTKELEHASVDLILYTMTDLLNKKKHQIMHHTWAAIILSLELQESKNDLPHP